MHKRSDHKGYSSVSRFQSGHTTVGCRLTDGTTGIGTECHYRFSRCHSRAGTAGRATRYMFRIPGVSGNAESEVSVVLPMANSSILVFPRITIPASSNCFMPVHHRSAQSFPAFLKKQVVFCPLVQIFIFHGDRYTCQRTGVSAAFDSFFYFFDPMSQNLFIHGKHKHVLGL